MTTKIKSGKIRQRYSQQYKAESLALAEKAGIPAAARQLGLHESQLYSWRNKARLSQDKNAEEERLLVDSGYCSAVYQRAIYERRMGEGQSFERIARHTAPPGYSRHALGVAVDFHPSASGFQHTSAYRWLRRHARHYGFYERYHKNNTLGVIWEPWHWEYRLERKGPADRPTQPAASIDRQTAPTDAAQPAAAQGQSDSTASPEPETAPQ